MSAKHYAINAELSKLLGLPRETRKAVITLEVGKLPVVEITTESWGQFGSPERILRTRAFDLVPKDDGQTAAMPAETGEHDASGLLDGAIHVHVVRAPGSCSTVVVGERSVEQVLPRRS